MKSILLAATMLAGLATGAVAADAVAELPAASTYNWSGAYVGVHAGGGWDHVDFDFLPAPNPANHSGSGALGGLQVGYNFQTDNIVYGVEADISAAGIDGSTECPNPTFTCGSKVSMLGSVRGRLGLAMNDLLIYGTGGLGYGTIDIYDRNSGGTTFDTKKTKAGWTVGLGAEYAFNQHWTAKAEYKYFDLGSDDYLTDSLVRAKTQIHTAVVGLNYKF
jgi:outer membrane immunogenic protein